MMENKKQKVIEELFKICKERNNFIFDNFLVKKVCTEIGFGDHSFVVKDG